MIKKCFLYFAMLLTPLTISSDEPPEIIDFNSTWTHGYQSMYDDPTWYLGHYGFNYAPEFTAYFSMLKNKYHIDTVIETGTFMGSTAVCFSLLFDHVYTIEIVDSTYRKTKEYLDQFSNIQFYLGSSDKVLKDILPLVQHKPVLFYLDAHWFDHWPLLAELEEICKTHQDNCVIVIDDFKVPGRPEIPYDRYGSQECSYEYIKPRLDEIFSGYTIHYLIPKRIDSRAKFVAIPTNWEKK